MNNGKAPGLVEISAELLKCGGPGLNALLHRMFLSIWAESVPQDWRHVLLISLFKKGSRDVCDNYWGIALFSIIGKVFCQEIFWIAWRYTQPHPFFQNPNVVFVLGVAQLIWSFQLACFRRSVLNWVLISISVSLTLQRHLTRLTVRCSGRLLGRMDCPPQFVALVRSLHSDMNAWVNFNSALTDPVSIVNGVNRGCAIFAIFFCSCFQDCFKNQCHWILHSI